MSPIDTFAEWYRQRALRSLPHYHTVEGPYRASPWAGRLIAASCVIGFVAWLWMDVL